MKIETKVGFLLSLAILSLKRKEKGNWINKTIQTGGARSGL